MPHDASRTTSRTGALPRRLAVARRSFCRHARTALAAQACVAQLFSGSRTVLGRDGLTAAEARRLGAAPMGETPGFVHALSAAYPVAGGVLRISALRAAGEPAFTAADADTLDSLGALARAMLDLATAAGEMASLWQGSVQVLDRLTLGVVLVSAKGEVLASNRTARDIARSQAPGNGSNNPDADDDTRPLRALSQSVRRGNGGTADAAEAFARLESAPNGRISVLATPLEEPNGGGIRPHTALFLSDAGRLFASYEDWLCRFYGLTRLEARLVTQIVEGRSLSDIAAALHVSIHTVRSYLKQIFGKTGVHRQADLVKLVVGGIGQVRADQDPARPAHLP